MHLCGEATKCCFCYADAIPLHNRIARLDGYMYSQPPRHSSSPKCVNIRVLNLFSPTASVRPCLSGPSRTTSPWCPGPLLIDTSRPSRLSTRATVARGRRMSPGGSPTAAAVAASRKACFSGTFTPTMYRTGRTRCSTTMSHKHDRTMVAGAVTVVVASAGMTTDAARGQEHNTTRRASFWERQVCCRPGKWVRPFRFVRTV